MKLKSLGLRTDLITLSETSEVRDKGDYMVIRTDSRPHFFWGNFLVMGTLPGPGDFIKWTQLFQEEIGPLSERGFMAFTWDDTSGETGENSEFLENGFTIERSRMLTARKVARGRKHNSDVTVRVMESETDWESYLDIHFEPGWEYGSDESQRGFLKSGMDEFRRLVDAGKGCRFGAELNGALVGELGVIWDGDVARFNNVGTHREHRRLGVCSTLVYEVAQRLLLDKGFKTLVMEADEDYHAGAIYESLGFKFTEMKTCLQYYDKSFFT